MKYKRILLKLSGESLQGQQKYGLSPEVLQSYAAQIKAAAASGVQIGIVIGGGNIFRGMTGAKKGFDRVKGDQMGMLATVINSLALQSALEDNGVRAKVLTSIRMEPIGEYFSKARAIEYLEAGCVVIIGGGTSNPYFTTDSASALRGIEIEADVLLKGTRVDGVYTADPEKDPAATKFDEITFEEVLDRRLKVMDLTAFTLCRENGLEIVVFDMDTPGNLGRVLAGEKVGTLVKPEGPPGRGIARLAKEVRFPAAPFTFHLSPNEMATKKSNKQLWIMLALIAAIAAAILLLPDGSRPDSSPTDPAALVKPGDTAPDFTVEMFDGSHVTLSDLRGKVVLLNFWATWCPPCRQELARVQADVIDRFVGEDFIFLPIARGEGREAVAAFRQQQGYSFPMGLDPQRSVYDRYASNHIPRNILIGRDGRIVLSSVGYEADEFGRLVEAIEQTLNQ